MVALAGELAEGVIFANVSLSHMAASLAALPAAKRNDAAFFIGNMIPTCVSDDVEAAKALCQGCRIRAACLEGAVERREPWGVWGGELFLRGEVVQL